MSCTFQNLEDILSTRWEASYALILYQPHNLSLLGRLSIGKSISSGKSLFHLEKVARGFMAGFRFSKRVQSARFMSHEFCHLWALRQLYPELMIIHKVIWNVLTHCISNRCLKKLHHKCHLDLYSPENGGSKEKVWVRNPRVCFLPSLQLCSPFKAGNCGFFLNLGFWRQNKSQRTTGLIRTKHTAAHNYVLHKPSVIFKKRDLGI